MSAEAVLNHHLGAFGEGDLDELMTDYTEDSVLIAPDQTLRGVAAIRGLFASFFEGLFKPGTYELTLDRSEIVGDELLSSGIRQTKELPSNLGPTHTL